MPDPKDITLLIVDDEEPLRKALVFDFKRKGFNVLDADNGARAFEIVKTQKIDVIVTDVRMPGGDGIELLKKTKEFNPLTPVIIFITGFADITLDEAYDRGADAIFAKPFDRKALLASVLKAVVNKDELWSSRKYEGKEIPVEIKFKFPELKTAMQGKLLSIGRGGMFVSLHNSFPIVGATVTFSIHFEEGTLLEIEGDGIVRWVRVQTSEKGAAGCGIEFEYLNDQSRQQVIRLIEEIKTKAFIPKG